MCQVVHLCKHRVKLNFASKSNAFHNYSNMFSLFSPHPGIFGTFNRESYDDWTLPSGEVTNNVYEFLNKYELSGKPQCQLKALEKKTQKKCEDAPSYRCEKFFNEDSSPLAQYFDIIDPEPFWDACIADTKPCGRKVDYSAYCKSVAAFVSLGKSMGQWIEYPASCSKFIRI